MNTIQHITQPPLIEPTQDLTAIQSAHRRFFASGVTLSVEFRRQQLIALRNAIRRYERELLQAIHADLHKPQLEGFLGEIRLVTDEIDYAHKHLPRWIKPERVPTPLLLMPARTQVYSQPFGTVLMISPWNYPFMLLFSPLVGVIAAGNTAVLKPSELSVHTADVIRRLVADTFAPEYVTTVQGDGTVAQSLLEREWDYIFFTGGTEIGRSVAIAAARHLTPCTLELGGKSPCIVDNTVDLTIAARRIAWGKFYNAGQSCIAPDYAFVHADCEEQFLEALREEIITMYGNNPLHSPDYGRIINERHFMRINRYLSDGVLYHGGETQPDNLYIAPSIIRHPSTDSPVMKEEIFGPVLPILTYRDINTVLQFINERPKPLALYIFSGNTRLQQDILRRTSAGGTTINDTLLHISTPHAPFGGISTSGIGAYHGKYSFATFSHRRTVVTKPTWGDIRLRYPPYRDRFRWIRRLLG